MSKSSQHRSSSSIPRWIDAPVARLGSWFLDKLGAVQQVGLATVQLLQAFGWLFRRPFRWHLFFKQMEFVGNRSLGMVLLTGLFTGMVITFQLYRTLRDFGSESIVGGVVAVAMARELGPVLSALMINARAGSAIAAEIGSMRVTEQIDALHALGVSPIQYLFTPRIIAGLLMTPLLTIIANIVGVAGGYLVGVGLLGVDGGLFLANVYNFVTVSDLAQGLCKAAVFGLLLTHVGAFKGYNTSGGAEGVGRATTEAVVVSAVGILFADYLITVFWQS